MASIKKQVNYGRHVKSCATCRFCLPPDDQQDINCKATGILIMNEATGVGNETLMYVCDSWAKVKGSGYAK